MVAINFQAQFASDIRSGRKTQTIRKTARCKTGDELQLYTGQRTKDCKLIGTARCAICEPITIAEDYIAVGMFRLPFGDAVHIAQIDGFRSLDAMRHWFFERYGSLPFHGYRIMWNDFRETESRGSGAVMDPMVQIDGAPFEEGQKLATTFFDTVKKHDRVTRLCAVTCIMMTWVCNEARAQGVSYDECVDAFAAGLKQSLNALDTEGTA